jgi:DNA invertase Pin-like site-specific DNA recombinase
MSDLASLKIKPRHLDRLAIVYVRQSHPQQQIKHPESVATQLRLRERIEQWGWPADRIRVLDGDLGKTGTTTIGRDDFAWLVSEVTLDHVGLVAGFQINRLAREDETVCHLIKVCSLFDTLLADQDGVYHPQDFNDRLVLTIKGLVGGVELYQIQQRLQHGRLERARRGEWMGVPPLGYVIGEDVPPLGYVIGEDRKLVFDPDQQAQHVTRMLFDQFERLGSVSGLLRFLHEHDVRLPIRTTADARDPIDWRRPHRETVRNVLRHPAYTGTYTWGRRPCDPKRAIAGRRGTGRIVLAAEDCRVFIPGNHAAFIDSVQFERNVRRLASHPRRGPQPSPARQTVSLLAGRVFCGRCHARMQPHYSPHLRYECDRRALDYGESRCGSLPGREIEQLVAEQILVALEPASLELSLAAADRIEGERVELERHWQLRLERARQNGDRAFRQYDAVEPENRLVARTLESRWEETLAEVRTLTEEYDRFHASRPLTLSATERRSIEELSTNLARLWNSPLLAVAEKRRVVELLLEKAVVTSQGNERVTVELHWNGGTVTRHEITRRVRRWSDLSRYASILGHIAELGSRGCTSKEIATSLNDHGYRTCRDTSFTSANVRQLRKRAAVAVEA